MSQPAYAADHISRIPTATSEGVSESQWKPVRHHFGIRAFGVNAYIARAAGETIVPEHDELVEAASGELQEHEELYFVSSGRATFTVAGETVDAPSGTLVFVRPAAPRTAVAHEPGTTILVVGAQPGVAFEVSPWEHRRLEEVTT